MIQHLSLAFGTTAIGVSAILGTYYYTYSTASLIAGAALDRVGAKKAVPIGIFILAIGCLLFSMSYSNSRICRKAASGCGLRLCVHRCSLSGDARFFGTLAGDRHRRNAMSGNAGRRRGAIRRGTLARTRSRMANNLALARHRVLAWV